MMTIAALALIAPPDDVTEARHQQLLAAHPKRSCLSPRI
jgi:hypothetical protein